MWAPAVTAEELIAEVQAAKAAAETTPETPDPELETADQDIKDWIATFAAWKPKKKKRVYAIFLHLTAIRTMGSKEWQKDARRITTETHEVFAITSEANTEIPAEADATE
jgi:hypothetical protein